ncbi:hypothetical protein HAZT_HAZT002717 [Hyalella azteca]|uniref:Receptor ligand binding region domain-containing protein n=1 Tax=Hyalella azteca TaxID=294128 RepID=A0A6A0GZY4_HYAAZ|nr:hypothetical protein HAZT_HAZT002717 [Hyalella azteca]
MMVHERQEDMICGPVMPQGGIQALEAMLFTLDYINDPRNGVLDRGMKVGARIFDDCDKDTYGLEQAVDFIKVPSSLPRNIKAGLGALSSLPRNIKTGLGAYRGAISSLDLVPTEKQYQGWAWCLQRSNIKAGLGAYREAISRLGLVPTEKQNQGYVVAIFFNLGVGCK